MIRPATKADLPALLDIEARAFSGDRLSSRSFRHLLTKAHARTLIAEDDAGTILGYTSLLFHQGTWIARLYSLAVAPEARGKGLSRPLLDAAIEAARGEDCAVLRLEVREDNLAARHLYEKAGFRRFGVHESYYEDGERALRLEKSLAEAPRPTVRTLPYYAQTLDFTCGPSALMMAMRALDPASPLDRREELRLWREATTIFMTAGHGGCSAHGLALAAWRRGFEVEIFVNDDNALLLNSVRGTEKKEVVQLVHEDMVEQVEAAGIPVTRGVLGLSALVERVTAGEVPLVLVSTWRMAGEKQPHWIAVSDVDEHFVYVNDPTVYDDRTEGDSIRMPIARPEFERMARFGRGQQKAAVVIKGRRHQS
ncbi:peptidase C39 family protein [Zavarzinia sp.]|uniref:peptidase C39 family protein n=1 Tax=Zavarzinia sp. TaxID=2027920 RepID=UPI0035676745